MELEELKKKNDAVILAHYYVKKEVQDIADYIGDSFFLAQKATELKEKTIVMAGVFFMGESVKILNMDKTVLMPNLYADCPMAHMVTVKDIFDMRKKYDDLCVVTYINSTAEIKAYSDVCVTSSNALKIVKKLPNKNIFFIPDKNLGGYIKKQVPDKNIILNDGFCPVHEHINVDEVRKYKGKATILAHPECREEVLEIADYIGSTKAMIKESSNYDNIILATESGIYTELEKKYTDKKFYRLSDNPTCVNMKKITVDDVKNVLENHVNEMRVVSSIREKALVPLRRMLELGA